MTVAAVLLAAGEGKRFEGPIHKLMSPFRGRPLVSWAIESALGAGLDETIVVTGSVELTEHIPPGVTVIENKSWASGQASSLRVALDWCGRQGHRSAVVGLGDQPLVGTSAWIAVAEAPTGPMVTATFAGKRRPPVRLDRSVWSLLPTGGDQGARVLMVRRPELVFEVACEGNPVDIDTIEDMEDARTWS
ncbi:MAG: nucleotidyltransferase family protein [Acidimicrobiales bacterium]